MVVGNDEINAQPTRGFRRSESANAHVNADDEANARGCGPFDHIVAHVVTVADAVRDVKIGCSSAQLNRGFKNYDGRGAVHVVVAIDQNSFLALDCSFNAVERYFHSGQQIRRMEIGERWRKEMVGSLTAGNATHHKKAGKNRSNRGIEFLREGARLQ